MVRVFVGTSEGTDDLPAEKALKYSLEKHCSEDIEVIFMRNLEDGFMGRFDCTGWATPFTNLRWAIPEYCNFEGRAIYMDVDQLNLKDISELYHIDLEGKPFASRDNRLCVMVFDNAKMKEFLAPVEKIKKVSNYGNSIYWDIVKKSKHFDPRWNCLDGEGRKINDIWHLHFTRMASQPWKPAWACTPPRRKRFEPHARPDLVKLWEQYRDEAILAEHNEN
jgi:hypothetical protein